ncbi:MAG: integrin alpha, partial [Alphaproteobacteria bacterium]|nr:integrin alpha [Alphaproteobacteria bacterium]
NAGSFSNDSNTTRFALSTPNVAGLQQDVSEPSRYYLTVDVREFITTDQAYNVRLEVQQGADFTPSDGIKVTYTDAPQPVGSILSGVRDSLPVAAMKALTELTLIEGVDSVLLDAGALFKGGDGTVTYTGSYFDPTLSSQVFLTANSQGMLAVATTISGLSYTLTVAATDSDGDTSDHEVTISLHDGIDLLNLGAESGFRFASENSGDLLGLALGAIDLNNDNYDDIVLGSPHFVSSSDDVGRTYLHWGRETAVVVDDDALTGSKKVELADLTAATGIVLDAGLASGTDALHLGYSVAAIGDVNGDGFADLAVSAPDATLLAEDESDLTRAGFTYIVFGTNGNTSWTLDDFFLNPASASSNSLVSARGFVIKDAALGHAGLRVAGNGDYNADGLADIVLANPLSDLTGSESGVAYVVFGNPNAGEVGTDGTRTVAVDSLDATTGVTIRYDTTTTNPGALLGTAIGAGADYNGDGVDDLLIASPEDGDQGRGAVYVIFGDIEEGLGDVYTYGEGAAQVLRREVFVDRLVPTDGSPSEGTPQGAVLLGSAVDGALGTALASGDINGDGIADLVIGAPDVDSATAAGRADIGHTYIVFGSTSLQGSQRIDELAADAVVTLVHDSAELANGHLGSALAVGDFDGDGLDDVIVAAPNARVDVSDPNDENYGKAWVIFGRDDFTTWLTDADNQLHLNVAEQFDPTAGYNGWGFAINGMVNRENDPDNPGTRDALGVQGTVHSGFDSNADGYDDIVLQAFDSIGSSSSYLLYGSDLRLKNQEHPAIVLGTAGDDSLSLNLVDGVATLHAADGGAGFDRLKLNAVQSAIDLTPSGTHYGLLSEIEVLDLADDDNPASNILHIAASSITSLRDETISYTNLPNEKTRDRLIVLTDGSSSLSDVVHLDSSFVYIDQVSISGKGAEFENLYRFRDGGTEVLIDSLNAVNRGSLDVQV